MPRTREDWYKQALEQGTSGDMVFDILKDWKEREKENKNSTRLLLSYIGELIKKLEKHGK
jgi:hypothetical protein